MFQEGCVFFFRVQVEHLFTLPNIIFTIGSNNPVRYLYAQAVQQQTVWPTQRSGLTIFESIEWYKNLKWLILI